MRYQNRCSLLAILFVLGCLLQSVGAQALITLTPSQSLEATIAGGQLHTYRVVLQAGQYVHFDVLQTSCDVAVTLTAPDGKKVEVNFTPFGTPESLSAEITASGEYQLTLRSTDLPKMSGTYRLQATVKAAADANDKKRLQAEGLLIELRGTLSPAQRLEKAQQLLTLWQTLGDRFWESNAHLQFANMYSLQSNWAKAIEHAENALSIQRELNLRTGVAYNLQRLASYQNRLTPPDKAIATAQEALAMARESKAQLLENSLLTMLGDFYFNRSLNEEALGGYDQALQLSAALGSPTQEARIINNKGVIAYRQKKYGVAQTLYAQALLLAREQKLKSLEATILRNLGDVSRLLNTTEKTADLYEQSLQISRELKDQVAEASTLFSYSAFLRFSQQYEKAMQGFSQVLDIRRALKDRSGEGYALVRMAAMSLEHFNRLEEAAEYFEKALLISVETKNTNLEVTLLNSFGAKYRFFVSPEEKNAVLVQFESLLAIAQKRGFKRTEALAFLQLGNPTASLQTEHNAIASLETALVLARQNQNKSLEVDCLNFLSQLCNRITDYKKSIEYLKQSVELSRSTVDWEGEFHALLGICGFYSLLGQNELAKEKYTEAFAILEKHPIVALEVLAFAAYGGFLSEAGEPEKANSYYERALAAAQKQKNDNNESSRLTAWAANYTQLQQYDKSLDLLQQALQKSQGPSYQSLVSWIHYNFGETYRGMKKFDLAISSHRQAVLANDSQNPLFLSRLYKGLMQDYQALNLADPAIFWGKQTINTLQATRGKLAQLDDDLQRSFLKSKEQTYRQLADLLISQGRLPEAEQVIRMLKDEEYFDYIRRDNKNGPKGEKASLTPEEAAAEKRYREIADQLAGIGAERAALLGKNERSADEEQRLAKLETDLTVASQVFQKFLDQLNTELSTRKAGDAAVAQLNDSQAFMDDLREMGKGAVALYTVVSEDKFHVILTTSDVRKSYSYPIMAADLNRKVLAFRDVLQNPKLDPLPLAQELYKILVAPLAKDLQAAKAETLMWSLDGVLRYVPMAALHDGEKYLVERWRNVVFTAASKGRLKDEPNRNWRALGLGVTKAHGEKIPALPAVVDEMRGIIRETGSKTGVLPGAIKLDEQFTQDAMLTGLRGRPSVVHVASHFQFQPGNETNSALLLGDGKFLSLAQIKSLPNVFSGVELLTLSACNTAMGSNSAANGKEIEGFGMLAQNQGAKAVVASLWPVADRSTKELMQEFYRLRETNNALKSEALRQAQRKLLRGELVSTIDLTQREIVHEATDKATNQPTYKPDPKKPYTHPYYWAPFILIGNWK